MRAIELQISDWVDIPQGKAQVIGIYLHQGYRVQYTDGKEICNCPVDDVKPIPITLDILEKNGLEKLYTDYYDLDVYEENDGLWRIVYHNLECSGFDESVLVSSVNELQHFLKHVGIEKDITL